MGGKTNVGEALKALRQQAILATKLHIPHNYDKPLKAVITAHLDASLQRLQTDDVDLYYQHRVNKSILVEDVAECMGELIKEGKIRGWHNLRLPNMRYAAPKT